MTDHNWTLPHVEAHKASSFHRDQVRASEVCGCFYCLAIFPPSEIWQWCDEGDGTEVTAICPHCCIDSVIGSSSGYPITTEFLKRMHNYWFDEP